MENRDYTFHKNTADYEEKRNVYIDAYAAGRIAERKIALEAYRLRCCNLFGNRCMERTIFGNHTKKVCDGDCRYIEQYKLELYKLES